MTDTVFCADGWRGPSAPQPLPEPEESGFLDIDGARIHYGVHGPGDADPVLLLHGGLGAAEDFGGQVDALRESHRVFAIDSRGHGRSTTDGQPFGYALLSRDVLGAMDRLGLENAAVVGWSDGGNIGLHLAINHPDRLTRLFALGANYSTSGIRPSLFGDALCGAYVGHSAAQYARISPTPDSFEELSAGVMAMWGTEPEYSEEDLGRISTPTLIAAGVYEEAIEETHTRRLAELIPNAELLLIENASHFAHWQQVETVNKAILDFLGSK